MPGSPQNYLAVIKVVGVGGGGCNAVNRMIDAGLEGRGVHRREHRRAVAADVRRRREARHRPPAHPRPRRRAPTPRSGGQAAEEHRDEIEEVLKGADMVFITAGKGGGTGTGGAPIIAEIAKARRRAHDRRGHPPVRLRGPAPLGAGRAGDPEPEGEGRHAHHHPERPPAAGVATSKTSMLNAFKMADEVLLQGVQGITDLITTPGLINTDFADVKMIITERGLRADGHRLRVGRRSRGRRGARRDLEPAARGEHRGRARHPAQRLAVRRTSGCSRSTRPPRSSPRPRTPTPTSSSARSSTTRSATRSASRSSPRASTVSRASSGRGPQSPELGLRRRRDSLARRRGARPRRRRRLRRARVPALTPGALQTRIEAVQARVADACARASSPTDSVTLVA